MRHDEIRSPRSHRAIRGLRLPRPAWPASVLCLLLVAIASPFLAAQQPAQAPQAVFRSTTRLVVKTVTVKDSDGKPIEGLTAQDFTVTEDGQPQDVAFLEFQRLEGTPGSLPPITEPPAEPVTLVQSVTQNQISTPPNGGITYQDRRLLVLYFDTSSMMPFDQIRAYTNAQKFVETQMTASDLVALMEFKNGAVRVRQDFTADRARLREMILLMMYGEDLDGDGMPDNTDYASAFGQEDGEFNIFNTDRQLAALQTAITMLGPLPEQKSLVYFASGMRLNGADNQSQLRATVNAAIRANVTLNPIDARGLVAITPLGDATQRSPGGLGMFTGALAANVVSGFQRSQDTLYALAKDTGGKAMLDYNDLSAGIVQAAQSLTSYYILGYYSTHTATDGKFRRVTVSVNRTPKPEIVTSAGYFAEKSFDKFTNADKERQLEEALLLDDPITDIRVAMEVNYFQLNRSEYFIPVAVKIPGSELQLARKGGASRTSLDFIGEIKDEYGVTWQNVRDHLDIKLSEDEAAQVASGPVRYETGFTLLPGKYVIKLLVRDAETGRMGTYQANFEIPNLEKEDARVRLSSVVLSSQRVPLGGELYTVKKAEAAQLVNPLVSDGQKLVPSVTRVFSKSKDLYVFLQAYQRLATTTQPLVAFVSFYRDNEKAFETQAIAVTEGLDPKSKAVPLRFSIPLEGLPVGPYDCQVTVLDPTAQKVAFWQAPIAVVP